MRVRKRKPPEHYINTRSFDLAGREGTFRQLRPTRRRVRIRIMWVHTDGSYTGVEITKAGEVKAGTRTFAADRLITLHREKQRRLDKRAQAR